MPYGVLPSNIVTHEHLPKVQDAIEKVREALRESKLMTDAGFGHMAREKELTDLLAKLEKFKAVYFPGH